MENWTGKGLTGVRQTVLMTDMNNLGHLLVKDHI